MRRANRCESLTPNEVRRSREPNKMGISNKRNVKNNIKTFLCSCQGRKTLKTKEFSGDSCGDPPVPMPNTVVKPANAESTWMEASWEDRKPLIFIGV